MIQTFELTKQYGRFTAVEGVSLTAATGEIYGFLGLNGAGKITLMRMLCGLLRPTKKHCQIGPVIVRGPQDSARLIPSLSFVSQELRFYEQATLRELLNVYAKLAQAPVTRGLDFARRTAVPMDRPCARLSPGQQRKAQLALALLKAPQYLLLDEPTAGLDPRGVAEMRDILRELHAHGVTIFFSSHVLGEVQALCTQVGVLHAGRLRYQGSLLERYAIQVAGDCAQAAAVLQAAGLLATLTPGSVQVAAQPADLPAIVARLTGAGVSVGLVQPVSLEVLFQELTAA